MTKKVVKKQDRVTIRTVAADAGVSVAAVSKVLRNAYGVSDALRLNVQKSIDKLGYRPNVAARGMRGRTFTTGLLLVEIRNPFLTQIHDGVNRVMEPSHYQMMIGVGRLNLPIEISLIESMIDYKMDGLIFVAPRLSQDVIANFAGQIPIVAIGYHSPAATNFDTFNVDDEAGARLAVEAFVARGFRDIAMVSLDLPGDLATNVIQPREAGYASGMAAAGLSGFTRVVHVVDDMVEKLATIDALLIGPNRPEAIFCWSDLDAVHVLGAAVRLGIRVPEDMSVIGFDDSWVAEMPVVGLASINQSGVELGALAAKALLERIEGRTEPRHVLLKPTLVMRDSLGFARRHAEGVISAGKRLPV